MNYWNKYGLAPFGENEILNAAIYERLGGEVDAPSIIRSHIIDGKLQYPPNPKEGWSHDNHLGYTSLASQFNVLRKASTTATLGQRISYVFFNLPIIWIFLGILTCLRGYETLWDSRVVPRTSGLRLLWLRCHMKDAPAAQLIFQFLLSKFHPCKSFQGALQYYYKDLDHPISKLSHKADI